MMEIEYAKENWFDVKNIHWMSLMNHKLRKQIEMVDLVKLVSR